jgi:hypothetical protein
MGNRITVWSALTGGVLAIASAAPVFSQQTNPETPPLVNAGFESPEVTTPDNHFPPEGWICFASKPGDKVGCSAKAKRTGSQSIVFKAPSAANGFEGASQEFVVTPTYHYGFTAYVIGDESDPLSAGSFGQVHIEWRGADGKELSRVYGPTWDLNLSSKRWERFFVEGDAPAGTVSGLVVVMFYSKTNPGRGTFYVDDCEFTGGPPKNASPRSDSRNRMTRFLETNPKLRQDHSESR